MNPPDEACGCDVATMLALSPMHPFRYLELACDGHRRAFQEASSAPSIRDWTPPCTE